MEITNDESAGNYTFTHFRHIYISGICGIRNTNISFEDVEHVSGTYYTLFAYQIVGLQFSFMSFIQLLSTLICYAFFDELKKCNATKYQGLTANPPKKEKPLFNLNFDGYDWYGNPTYCVLYKVN